MDVHCTLYMYEVWIITVHLYISISKSKNSKYVLENNTYTPMFRERFSEHKTKGSLEKKVQHTPGLWEEMTGFFIVYFVFSKLPVMSTLLFYVINFSLLYINTIYMYIHEYI